MRYPDSKNENSIQEGLEFQDFVMEALAQYGDIVQVYSSKKYQLEKGESIQQAEIKLDNRCTETDRLSIEIEEKTSLDGEWVKSGIYTKNNSIRYIQGNKERFWVFSTRFLRKLHSCIDGNGKKQYEEHEEPTIKAFYLPLEDASKYCICELRGGELVR